MKKPKHTQFKDFNNFNYGLKNFTYYRNLSQEEKRAFVNDWHNIALHPILDCDNSWLIFFENMTEREFLQNIPNQQILFIIEHQQFDVEEEISKTKDRILKYSPITENNAKKVEKLEKRLQKLQKNLESLQIHYQKVKNGKRLCIVIDANNVSKKYINKVIALCNNLYKSGVKELKILVSSSDKSKNSKIEYYYDNEQLEALEQLNNQLDYYNKTSNIKDGCQLKFSEFDAPYNILDYQNLWSFEHVKNANEFIEDIRIEIKNKKLSPLEATLFIYQTISNSFCYKDSLIWSDAAHTIIGALSEKQLISCGGFASFFKIAIDVLNDENLQANFLSSTNCLTQEGHSFNSLTIHDKKYLNKGGTYIIDLTLDTPSITEDDYFSFSGFLAKMNDIINPPNHLTLLSNDKSRFDQVYYDYDEIKRTALGQSRNKNGSKLSKDIVSKVEKQTNKIEKIDNESEDISYLTIIKAYLNMREKIGIPYTVSEIEYLIQQTCQNIISFYPKGTKSSWLKLVDIEKYKRKFGGSCFVGKNSELENYAKDKIAQSILSQKGNDKTSNPNDKTGTYYTKEYFDLLKYVADRAENQCKYFQKD